MPTLSKIKKKNCLSPQITVFISRDKFRLWTGCWFIVYGVISCSEMDERAFIEVTVYLMIIIYVLSFAVALFWMLNFYNRLK